MTPCWPWKIKGATPEHKKQKCKALGPASDGWKDYLRSHVRFDYDESYNHPLIVIGSIFDKETWILVVIKTDIFPTSITLIFWISTKLSTPMLLSRYFWNPSLLSRCWIPWPRTMGHNFIWIATSPMFGRP
jgi:hypothetical protein